MASIFSNIYGDSQLDQLTKEIDNAVKSVPIKDANGSTTSETSSSNLISQFLSSEDSMMSDKSLKKNPFYVSGEDDKNNGITEISTLLDKLSIAPERSQRYRVYDELYASCPLIKKIISVWVDNLFQKNPVTGKSLLIKSKADESDTDITQLDDQYENKKKMADIFIDEILDYFDLIEKLKNKIVPHQLMYGDSFVELIDLKEYDPLKKESGELFLSETSIDNNSFKKKKVSETHLTEEEILESIQNKLNRNTPLTKTELERIEEQFADLFFENGDDDILAEAEARKFSNNKEFITLHEKKESERQTSSYESFYEYYQNKADGKLQPFLKTSRHRKSSKKKDSKPFTESKAFKNNKDIDLSSLLLLVHSPKNIIVFSTKYGSKLGYIEVIEKENLQTTNIGQQLSSIIGRVVTVGGKNINSADEITTDIVKCIIKKILRSSNKNSNNKTIEQMVKNLDPEVYNTIKKLIVETYRDDPKAATIKKLKARFIPLERMFHFTVKASEYAPYGTSVIDPLVLQGKLYMLSQLSNIIMKLSRAAPLRKWIIDVGPLQDQAKYVEQIKRELYNQKVKVVTF